ncbi:hypothetical protein [Pseudodonghicola xiamenensis]|uniref:Uncharacterized protein n=1 Tax=Pseudodonghicola xiamenensis TaxID=337702 RepID=A0A8J3HBS3_9RHOB|nr:hypothetical protein [Pseudodonghicola xiamenensis]GHH05610.1 hypothetical protein GCM10010961_44520 [Pseudodonghicola xiamenensis]
MKLYDLTFDQLESEYPSEAADALQNVENMPGLNGRDLYELIEEEFARITEGVEAIGQHVVAVAIVHNRDRKAYPAQARGKFTLKAVPGSPE